MLTNMTIRRKFRVLTTVVLMGLSLLSIIAIESERASSAEDGIVIAVGGQHQASNEIAHIERSAEGSHESVRRFRV